MSSSPVRGRPPKKDYAALYEGWPDVDVDSISDPNDRKLLRLVHNFRTAFNAALDTGEVTSLRDLARKVGTSHAVLHQLLNGAGWPSAETVARLETVLERKLWPTQPMKQNRKTP